MNTATFVRNAIQTVTPGVLVVLFSLAAVSVTSGQDKPQAKTTGPDIMLMQPSSPKSGDNQFEVMVKGVDGKPITDADVSVVLVMPKTATMAEMRNEVKLKAAGNGTYKGSGTVMMAGTWNATVTVMKAGKTLGQKKVTLTAK